MRYTLSLFLLLGFFAMPQASAQDAAPPPLGAIVVKDPLALPATDDGLPGAGPLRRNDSFQKKWLNRRTQFLKQAPEERNRVVLLGDSITEGWKDLPKKHFPELPLVNRGIGGDTSRGMLIRLHEDVIALQPTAVVMLLGTNDISDGIAIEDIAGNLELIVGKLKAANPNLPIILCLTMPSTETKQRSAERIKALNNAYLEIVKGDPQITVLDTWTLFADENGNAKREEFPDLLHPNAEGYAKFAAALRPLFATLGFVETEPEPFTLEPGFKSLFNGKNLAGWGAREKKGDDTVTPFGEVTASPDGRYVARNGRLIVTTPPEGRRVQAMWTVEEFPHDFVLKLEFRCTPNADSGVFIRKPQLQCRDYLLAGPYKNLKNYKQQDWNELVITVKGQTAHCTCNGEVLQEALALPPTGPIGLEGDRGQLEYRNIRISEAP